MWHAKKLISGLASVGLSTALMAPMASHAAIYNGNFDPYDFFGVHRFFVDDVCLQSDGFHSTTGVPPNGYCTAALLSGNTTFQYFGYTGGPLLATSGPHDFSGFTSLPDYADITGVDVLGGELVGVQSNLIGPLTLTGTTGGLFDGRWWLQWEVNIPDPVNLFRCTTLEGECSPTLVSVANVVTFVRELSVPEPGSLVLLLSAAAAALATRRRRRTGNTS